MNNPLSQPLAVRRESQIFIEAILLLALMLVAVVATLQVVRLTEESKVVNRVNKVDGLLIAADWSAKGSSIAAQVNRQETNAFRSDDWVVPTQVFVSNTEPNAWVEFEIRGTRPGTYLMQAYLTKAADYGMIQISVDGKPTGERIDLYSGAVTPVGPIDLGKVEIKGPSTMLRVDVVGHNTNNHAPFYQFGVQGVKLTTTPL